MADESKKKAYYDSLVRAGVVQPETSFEAFNLKIRDSKYAKIIYSGLKTASELNIVKGVPNEQEFNSVLQVGQFPTQPELSEDIPEVKEIKEMGVPASKQTAIPPVSNISNQPQPTPEETQIAPINQQAGQVQGGMPQGQGLSVGQFQITDTRIEPQEQSVVASLPEMEPIQQTVTAPTGQVVQTGDVPQDGMGYFDYLGNALQRGYNRGEIADYITATGKTPTGEEFSKIAELTAQNDKLATSQAMQDFANNPDLESTLKSLPEIALESLSSLYRHGLARMGAGAIAGGVAGSVIPGAGTLVGVGTGALSGMTVAGLGLEVSGTIMDGLRELNIDTKDANAIKTAFSNPAVMDYLKQKAYARGIPIAALDAVSMGVAGKILGKPVASAVGRGLQVLGEAGIQGGLGATGELLAQINSGENIKGYEILAEGLAEIPGSIPEVGIAVLSKNKGAGKDTKVESARLAIGNPDMPIEAINESIDVGVGTGEISVTQATELKQEVAKAMEIDAKIPAEIKDTELRVTAIGLIEERDNLNAQLEAVDEAFKPAIQEKIKGINEQLAGMATPEAIEPTPSTTEVAIEEVVETPTGTTAEAEVTGNTGGLESQKIKMSNGVDLSDMNIPKDGMKEGTNELTSEQGVKYGLTRVIEGKDGLTGEGTRFKGNPDYGIELAPDETTGRLYRSDGNETSTTIKKFELTKSEQKKIDAIYKFSETQKEIKERLREVEVEIANRVLSEQKQSPQAEVSAQSSPATEQAQATPTEDAVQVEATAEANPALVDVESTAKALEGVDKKRLMDKTNGILYRGQQKGRVYQNKNKGAIYFTPKKEYAEQYGDEIFNAIIPNDVFDIREIGNVDVVSKWLKGRIEDIESKEEYDNWDPSRKQFIKDAKSLLKSKDPKSIMSAMANVGFGEGGGVGKTVVGKIEKEFMNDNNINSMYQFEAGGMENADISIAFKDFPSFDKQVSEAYHSAKAKPESERTAQETELVQEVEQLLTPESQAPTTETVDTTTETVGQEGGQDVKTYEVFRGQDEDYEVGEYDGTYGKGKYYTGDKNSAKVYGKNVTSHKVELSNPFIIKGTRVPGVSLEGMKDYINENVIPKGYDGVILLDAKGNIFELVKFETPTTTPTEVTLTPINATDVETITKIENATEKGRELALNKPTNKGLKRAFEAFQDLSDRARKAGIYDGKTLKIGGQEIEVDTPAKFKAFLANQWNFDALSEAVDKSEIQALKSERDSLLQQFKKEMGKATMNLNPQQVSLLAQIAWKNLQILLRQTKLSSAGIASQIKKVVNNAILEANQMLAQAGQKPLNPDKDDITNIINSVRKLAQGVVTPPSQTAGQIGTAGQPNATQSNVYTKEQEELARKMETKMDEGKPFIARSEPFWTAVKRKTAELRQKLDSPKELLNFVEKMIGSTPGSSYNRTRELPLGRAMEQLRGKARSLALPYMERISNILKPIESNLPDFEKYLIYRRIIDRAVQDKLNQDAYNQGLLKKKPTRRTTGGMTETNADILLNDLRNRIGADLFDKFTQAGDELQQVFDDNLKDLVDAGVFTQERYDAIKAQNEFYVPFDVVQRDFRGNVITGTEYDRTNAQGQSVVKKIKGIDTPKNAAEANDTVDVFYKMMQNGDIDVDSYYYLATESITDARNQGNITQQEYEELMNSLSEPGLELHSPLNKTLNIINASQYQVARQGYMEDVDRLVDADTNNDYFKRLEDGEKLPSGMAIITYYKDGVQQRVAVDEKLKQAIDGMTKPELSAFQQALKLGSIPFKLAATSASITFLPVNFVIDTVRTLTSKAGLGSGSNITERVASVVQMPILYSEALVESIIGNLLNTKLGNALGLKSITPELMYKQYEEWRKSPSYSEGTYMNYFTDKLKSGRTTNEIEDAKFLENVQRRTQTILGNPKTAKAIAEAMLGAKQKTRLTVDSLIDIINIISKMLENSHKIYGNIKLSGSEAGVRRGLDTYIGGYIDKLHSRKKLTQSDLENVLEEINDEILNNIGSPNFEQIPPNMRAASVMLPFFGAAVKGNMTDISRMMNAVNTGASSKERKDALIFSARNAAVFTIPAFMTGLAMALKSDDDEDKKMYDDMDENSKWKNMIIPIERDVDGEGVQTDFITIPIRGLPVIFNSIGRASGQAFGEAIKDKLSAEEIKKISKDLLTSSGSEMMTFNLADKTYLSDIDPETGERKEKRKEEEWVNRSMSAISGINPLIKYPLERIANKNFFGKYSLLPDNIRGKRLRNAIINEVIDPSTGEPVSPSLLKNKFTPEYSVNLSKKLERNGIRITPIAIDHFFDTFLAGAPEKFETGASESMKRRFLWKERKLAYGEKPKTN